QIRALDDAFTAARSYARTRTAGTATDTDLRWEAMLPVLRGELPVFVHADDLKQIRAALAFAQRQGVKITIVGGLDGWRGGRAEGRGCAGDHRRREPAAGSAGRRLRSRL